MLFDDLTGKSFPAVQIPVYRITSLQLRNIFEIYAKIKNFHLNIET